MADKLVDGYGTQEGVTTLFRELTEEGQTFDAQAMTLAPYDAVTGAALTIDVIHHEVHEGEMFNAEFSNTSVANGASVDLRVTTGAKEAHMVFEVTAGGQALAYLYEAATISAGTSVTAYNMNRNSANTPTVAVRHTPTVTATGSTALVNGRIVPGGNSPTTRVGGGIRAGVERPLKRNTEYLIRVTNNSGGTVAIGINMEWYEE